MAKLNFSLSIHDDKGNFYIKRAVGKCILRQHNRYARISRTLRGDLYKFGRLQFEKEAFLCDFSTGLGSPEKRGYGNQCSYSRGRSHDKEERIKSYRSAREYFKNKDTGL